MVVKQAACQRATLPATSAVRATLIGTATTKGALTQATHPGSGDVVKSSALMDNRVAALSQSQACGAETATGVRRRLEGSRLLPLRTALLTTGTQSTTGSERRTRDGSCTVPYSPRQATREGVTRAATPTSRPCAWDREGTRAATLGRGSRGCEGTADWL